MEVAEHQVTAGGQSLMLPCGRDGLATTFFASFTQQSADQPRCSVVFFQFGLALRAVGRQDQPPSKLTSATAARLVPNGIMANRH